MFAKFSKLLSRPSHQCDFESTWRLRKSISARRWWSTEKGAWQSVLYSSINLWNPELVCFDWLKNKWQLATVASTTHHSEKQKSVMFGVLFLTQSMQHNSSNQYSNKTIPCFYYWNNLSSMARGVDPAPIPLQIGLPFHWLHICIRNAAFWPQNTPPSPPSPICSSPC